MCRSHPVGELGTTEEVQSMVEEMQRGCSRDAYFFLGKKRGRDIVQELMDHSEITATATGFR